MGKPIAERLLVSQGRLTVWNRTPAKAAALAARGARTALSPADAAADITLTVLTDLPDVKHILGGDDGLLAGWRRANIDRPVLVVHGTVSPTDVAALAEELADEGIGLLDAPLSGGVAGAESGALSVMVGGEDWAVTKARPILEAVGSTVVHFGPPGAGEIAKACNQVVVASTVTAIAESLVLADAWGLDRAQLLRILAGGLADSEVLRQKRERWLDQDFTGGGSAANQLKDLRFAAETARAKGLRLPLSLTLKQAFEHMISEGFGDLDHSAIELILARTQS
jgi:2-hydroxy-3-oxopropionate reductase